MRASDAGWLLSAIARGGVVELPGDREWLLEAMRAAGLVRAAPDPGPEREQLAQLRAELARVGAARAAGDASPELVGRERGLRSAIVELSERLAESEGAAEVRAMSASPYRGGVGAGQRWQLTQRGRTLLNDLAPRVLRMGDASIASFEVEMRALRETLAWRVARAAEIAKRMRFADQLGAARLSVPIGLSAVRAEPQRVARAFDASFEAVRRASQGFDTEQDAAGAECLCLTAGDLGWCERPEAGAGFATLRAQLLREHVPQNPEDALDAAALLTTVPYAHHGHRIALARELATHLAQRDRKIWLSLALIALAGHDSVPPHLPYLLLELDDALSREVPDVVERMIVAVLLAAARNDPSTQLAKWRALRQYLSRFAPDGMAVAAALATWIALDPAEILDTLRLASAELQKHRLSGGGAETMTLAIKLLLGMAALAAGSEGDPEERLALAPTAPLVPHLGLQGALAPLPLASTAVTVFHRTVLDAAAEWERTFHPTHSSYVYGGTRRSYGWG